ncbi:tryptophan synthase, beta subunit [Owenweeksia hongkongensis DSM 17368]|uniref:Multifunctional fusion protein n=1 Tax=Owenweeksia hongkongensis (strain DSM 17368 / CIP 108786 / JCM 12287 / NRRL B-23963 / UST20020801) TaxID=926562 RepID=G8R334_OWEHD|nr:tryptophan synthase subunit beta [Owenweeksia hongkongensis]AEV34059.1 tryptophan synthase, beta subunit [Owenweeksia hongkongensis DSM 17368]
MNSSKLKLKVCGLKNPTNIMEVVDLQPDFAGFIFYPKSPRYAENLDPQILHNLSSEICSVGVFVNESSSTIMEIVNRYKLRAVQLHGDETPSDCETLKNQGLVVIKAFGVHNDFDFTILEDYLSVCDYFLFDTKTSKHGGSGQKFKWEILNNNPYSKPYFLSGGIGPTDLEKISKLNLSQPPFGIDVNSQFETKPGEKDISKLKDFMKQMNTHYASANSQTTPDADGFYGNYGGAFIPELLYPNVEELRNNYLRILEDPSFKEQQNQLLKDYVGRPTPLYFAKRLSEHFNTQIYLKREDLCHTGAHKINNTIGQILLAKKLGKTRIIAETGAGQHGVATATAAALMNLPCIVYMGALDIQRQAPNVSRMRMLGAEVRAVHSGSKTLKDATNEAIRDWINNPEDTHYILGSVVGPHPYPDMVTRFQAVISEEIKHQMNGLPDYVLACVGGGSNAIGAFYHFLKNKNVQLYGIEAAGHGVNTNKTAATLAVGSSGVIHASKTILMQTEDGQIIEPHSISAGLDYPGIGPIHSHLHETNRVKYVSITDEEALEAGYLLCKLEGIIPALESAHALAYLKYLKPQPHEKVVVNLSGRGDKDLNTYLQYFEK